MNFPVLHQTWHFKNLLYRMNDVKLLNDDGETYSENEERIN